MSSALCKQTSLLLVPSQLLVPHKASNDKIKGMVWAGSGGTHSGGPVAFDVHHCTMWEEWRPRGTDQRRGRVVLVDEHRTSRVSSAVNGQQPYERQLNKRRAIRPEDWKPPAGQVHHRLVRPAWSQQRDQPAAARQPHSQQPQGLGLGLGLGPGSTPLPAKHNKRTEAERAAEPSQPTRGKGKAQGKAAKAKPAPQPGRWVDRDCNAALNMQRIGESKWRPLVLCYWPEQGALPAKGKKYPELGYKRLVSGVRAMAVALGSPCFAVPVVAACTNASSSSS
ncbi:hypothetical protein QJQ45_012917 [Haematococcus lacustris]|nr:hypothetical protein QJQ45_012917 [Haematococcus lacustris]